MRTLLSVCLALLLASAAQAQLPTPLVALSFPESSGTTTVNSGSRGGTATFVQQNALPVFSSNVPAGASAPAANSRSADFGTIAAGQGGRAIDLVTNGDGTLGAFSAFTVCGWINCRSLTEGSGGNRIAFALASPDGPGFDLVQTSSALRIGINQWPDGGGGGGPLSSSGKITADAAAGSANWVFFAVSYDSALASGQVKYYFGKPTQLAALDVTANYNRGAVNSSGRLTLGNFGSVVGSRTDTGPTGSRVFRGLIDELRVFNQALTLAQVRTAQTAPVDGGPAPTVTDIIPTPGGTVRRLTQIEVLFSTDVQGVNATDLLVNGSPATSVATIAPDEYVFTFTEPPAGPVTVAWAASHGITSTTLVPFGGGSWSYIRDPNVVFHPIISEFMADNDDTLHDQDGDSPDWIELHNPDAEPLDLQGYHLTDDSGDLTKWTFPAVTIPPNGYLIVFASGKNLVNPAAPLHTQFKLAAATGYLALVSPAGTVLSEFVSYPAQQEDISYGRDRLNPEIPGYFENPTPGAPNSASGATIAPAVSFSQIGGSFGAAFSLTLSTTNPNAVIRYELVNSAGSPGANAAPGPTSPIYSVPLTISGSIQVRARAFLPGSLPGPPRSETYLNFASSATAITSNLPILLVHTLGGGDFNQSAFKNAHFSVYEPVAGRTSLANPPTVATRAGLRVRGNTSASSPKKSWSLELRDEFNDGNSMPLLGMPAESDWVLYGPNNIEPVFIHNPFAYELARRTGQWAPRTRFVEVFLNTSGGQVTSSNYQGLYVLVEKIKIGADRVDAKKLDAEDITAPSITGGYLLQIDRLESGESGFTPIGVPKPIAYVQPKESEITLSQWDSQEQYIKGFMNEFKLALNSAGYADPVNGYARYLEVGPAIDNHIVKTLCFTVDAFDYSTYLFKPRGGKLVLGPVWDFDRALESADGRDNNPAVWRSQVPEIFDFFNYSWWNRLFSDVNFWQRWVDRYQELRGDSFSNAAILALVDSQANEVREGQARDVARWPSVTAPRGGSYQAEVDRMKTWLTSRLAFMDGNFLGRPALSQPGGPIASGTTITLVPPAAPAGTQIYYTLDGTDPRLPGGAVSPAAQLYAGPITLNANTNLVARSRNLAHSNLTGGSANGNPPVSTPWSGLTRGVFVVNPIPLIVTEIMYHPVPTPGDPTTDSEDFEFVELKNIGPGPLGLVGVSVGGGISYTFTAGSGITSLPGGGMLLLVKKLAAFQMRYPGVTNVAGEYTGSLANEGDRLTLHGPLSEPILDFTYDYAWYSTTDGQGASLVNVNENAASASLSTAAGWRPSTAPGGSPGITDPPPFTFLHQPLSQGAAAGRSITLSAETTGSAPPFIFEWQRGPAVVATQTVNSRISFFTFLAPAAGASEEVCVVARNAVLPTGLISATATITGLADGDGDGLPDAWETSNGLNPANAADAAGDLDGDGFSNAQEYLAGTDPRDAMNLFQLRPRSTAGGVALDFTAAANRTYTILTSDDLAAWMRLKDFAARTTVHPQSLTVPADTTRRFYRLVTPRQPE
jgi:hypothetical protein